MSGRAEGDNMTITITYEYDPNPIGAPCHFAKTEINGRMVYRSGSSFEEAKENLLKYLRQRTQVKVPEKEEIEL